MWTITWVDLLQWTEKCMRACVCVCVCVSGGGYNRTGSGGKLSKTGF